MNILAIDPGTNGGFAMSDGSQNPIVWAMPKTADEVCQLLREYAARFPNPLFSDSPLVYLEQVGGFHRGMEGRQPGSAMFNFGCGYGVILGACCALDIRVVSVTPQMWQRHLGVYATGAKDTAKKRELKAEAIRLYPELAARKITLKTCDALLILEYALRCEMRRDERAWRM